MMMTVGKMMVKDRVKIIKMMLLVITLQQRLDFCSVSLRAKSRLSHQPFYFLLCMREFSHGIH